MGFDHFSRISFTIAPYEHLSANNKYKRVMIRILGYLYNFTALPLKHQEQCIWKCIWICKQFRYRWDGSWCLSWATSSGCILFSLLSLNCQSDSAWTKHFSKFYRRKFCCLLFFPLRVKMSSELHVPLMLVTWKMKRNYMSIIKFWTPHP